MQTFVRAARCAKRVLSFSARICTCGSCHGADCRCLLGLSRTRPTLFIGSTAVVGRTRLRTVRLSLARSRLELLRPELHVRFLPHGVMVSRYRVDFKPPSYEGFPLLGYVSIAFGLEENQAARIHLWHISIFRQYIGL